MDQQDLRTLRFLEEIEKNHNPSQRDLAKKLNISLGLANSFVKRLSNKGYFKISTIPKNRIKYILTPKGFTEKSRLTYKYIYLSYHFYKNTRRKLQKLFADFIECDIRKVVFYGAGDIAEIAYLSLLETPIELTGIVDDTKAGRMFFNKEIEDIEAIHALLFDKILITTETSNEFPLEKIKKMGITTDKITTLF